MFVSMSETRNWYRVDLLNRARLLSKASIATRVASSLLANFISRRTATVAKTSSGSFLICLISGKVATASAGSVVPS